jgi:4,5-DOPA dioxygenase extradiol
MNATLPALFLGHGSPMNALEDNPFTCVWHSLGEALLPRTKAVLAISAHWVTPGLAVTAMASPQTIHDFAGFPAALGAVRYPAPGDPGLAQRVAALLQPEPVEMDMAWGLDHGTWSLLVHLFPKADIPVVQLSLDALRTPAEHLALARRLRPLRGEGTLILGSGNVVHNLQAMDWRRPEAEYPWARQFSDAVRDALLAGDHAALAEYPRLMPQASRAVPTAEHYLPLLYVAGVADAEETPTFLNDQTAYGSIGMLGVAFGLEP